MRMKITLARAVALAAALFFVSVAVAQADGFIDPTSISVHADPGTSVPKGTVVTISGKLKADHAFCRNDSKVTLRAYGESQGDQFPGGAIDSTVTADGGRYSFDLKITEQVRVRVWFKGKVGGVHPDIKTCQKSRSKTVTFTLA